MTDQFPELDDGARNEFPKPGPPPSWCRCVRNKPYTVPDWDLWVSDRDRAFCRRCGRDVNPAAAGEAYAQACQAEDVEEARYKLVERWEDCPVCGDAFLRARPGWTCCLSCAVAGDPDAEAAFIAKAKEVFPGSVEPGVD